MVDFWIIAYFEKRNDGTGAQMYNVVNIKRN